MIKLSSSGSFAKTNSFLKRLLSGDMYAGLDAYGKMGVNALAAATPRDSGETANSWTYKITKSKTSAKIEWYNTHEINGTNIAIILQYGHGTGTGGWVQGRNYINPALRPVFDKIAAEVWKKVTKS